MHRGLWSTVTVQLYTLSKKGNKKIFRKAAFVWHIPRWSRHLYTSIMTKGNKRAKQSQSNYSVYRPPPDIQSLEPTERAHRHISFHTGADGRLGTSVSFLNAPASPKKSGTAPQFNDTFYEEPPEEVMEYGELDDVEASTTESGFVDPDYVTFLNDITLEPLPRKRRRPKSVSFFSLRQRLKIIIFFSGFSSASMGPPAR